MELYQNVVIVAVSISDYHSSRLRRGQALSGCQADAPRVLE